MESSQVGGGYRVSSYKKEKKKRIIVPCCRSVVPVVDWDHPVRFPGRLRKR